MNIKTIMIFLAILSLSAIVQAGTLPCDVPFRNVPDANCIGVRQVPSEGFLVIENSRQYLKYWKNCSRVKSDPFNPRIIDWRTETLIVLFESLYPVCGHWNHSVDCVSDVTGRGLVVEASYSDGIEPPCCRCMCPGMPTFIITIAIAVPKPVPENVEIVWEGIEAFCCTCP